MVSSRKRDRGRCGKRLTLPACLTNVGEQPVETRSQVTHLRRRAVVRKEADAKEIGVGGREREKGDVARGSEWRCNTGTGRVR